MQDPRQIADVDDAARDGGGRLEFASITRMLAGGKADEGSPPLTDDGGTIDADTGGRTGGGIVGGRWDGIAGPPVKRSSKPRRAFTSTGLGR